MVWSKDSRLLAAQQHQERRHRERAQRRAWLLFYALALVIVVMAVKTSV